MTTTYKPNTVYRAGQQLLTTTEAAEYLTVRTSFLLDKVQQGRIECLRGFGRELRFTKEQCDQFIADRVEEARQRPGRRIEARTRRSAAGGPATPG